MEFINALLYQIGDLGIIRGRAVCGESRKHLFGGGDTVSPVMEARSLPYLRGFADRCSVLFMLNVMWRVTYAGYYDQS